MVDAVAQSLADVADDLAELRYLALAMRSRVGKFAKAVTSSQTVAVLAVYDDVLREIAEMLAEKKVWNEASIRPLTALKTQLGDTLRRTQGIAAALLASTDWQAPSYLHSLTSQAGTQTGKIDGTINDYKRDHHIDAKAFEKTFRKEYIDAPFRFPPQALVTSSGMSAFTTVVMTLAVGGKVNGPVLVGKSSYFENKSILDDVFPGMVQEFDEMQTEEILRLVRETAPAVIVLDSLCNSDTVAVPDLARLLPAIAEAITRPTTLILDNTGMSVMYQPLKDLPRFGHALTLIVVESLNKYYQFGFDRVTGGIIWREGLAHMRLFGLRQNLGTNMPDASVLAMPEPSRPMLEKRLQRFNRNATLIATTLDAHLRAHHTPISHVVYPGLPAHPAYAWAGPRAFRGSYFVLAFKPRYHFAAIYQMWIRLAIEEAAKDGLQLTAGTSFGFSSTRVYLTAIHASRHAKPFMRVSVGTEVYRDAERMAQVFIRATTRLTHRFPV